MTTSINLSDLHGAPPSIGHAAPPVAAHALAPRPAITCSISHSDGKTLFDFDCAGQCMRLEIAAILDESQWGQIVQLFLQHAGPGCGTVIYGMAG